MAGTPCRHIRGRTRRASLRYVLVLSHIHIRSVGLYGLYDQSCVSSKVRPCSMLSQKFLSDSNEIKKTSYISPSFLMDMCVLLFHEFRIVCQAHIATFLECLVE